MEMKLDSYALAEATVLSLKNAIRLHLDSYFLYKNKSYPTAYYISIMALEEIGKMKILDKVCFFNDCGARDKALYDWFRDTFYHKPKQMEAIDWGRYIKRNEKTGKIISITERYKHIFDGDLNKRKENSIYVGITKGEEGESIVNDPTYYGKDDAIKQMTITHEVILRELLYVKKSGFYYDTEELTLYIYKHGMKLYNKLLKLKIPISVDVRLELMALEKEKTIIKSNSPFAD